MIPTQTHTIPQLSSYFILHNIADKLDIWKESFILEVNQRKYSNKVTRFDNEVKLAKNHRGTWELILKKDEKNIIAFLNYKFPFYLKFLGAISFIMFAIFLFLGVYISAISEPFGESILDYFIILSFIPICIFLIFCILFVFVIAEYDSKRGGFLPNQKEELKEIAHKTPLNTLSKRNFEKMSIDIKSLFGIEDRILIFYDLADKINVWRAALLELIRDNNYLIKDQDFFNYFQVIKDKRVFEIGFKTDQSAILVHLGSDKPLFTYKTSSASLFAFILIILSIYYDQISYLTSIICLIFGLFFVFLILYKIDSFHDRIVRYINELKGIVKKSQQIVGEAQTS